ncbi:MAG: hypothetical protein AAF587_31305 [Bacteroidota bacterium]
MSFGQEEGEDVIRNTFEQYKTAILNDRGEEAFQYVDSRTHAYYNKMAEVSRQADSLAVDSMDLLDKMMVLTIRHRATKEEIQSFDGKRLLIFAIKNGMIDKKSVGYQEIGAVSFEGKEMATGQLRTLGQDTPVYFDFHKEEGNWKVDLTSVFAISGAAMKKMFEESGEDENEMLDLILEMMTGTAPTSAIWHPIE